MIHIHISMPPPNDKPIWLQPLVLDALDDNGIRLSKTDCECGLEYYCLFQSQHGEMQIKHRHSSTCTEVWCFQSDFQEIEWVNHMPYPIICQYFVRDEYRICREIVLKPNTKKAVRFSAPSLPPWTFPEQITESIYRRPAFWMRGKPVTPEQAFEIIRRTDFFFYQAKDAVPLLHFPSWWFHFHYPKHYGFCRPDGRIGIDSITDRWPSTQELLSDAYDLLDAFPFLDFIYLLWESEEELFFAPECLAQSGMPQIQYGLYVHDQTAEILPARPAWQIFCRYQKQYGEDPLTYVSEYNHNHNLIFADEDYFNRCLCASGLYQDTLKKSSIFYLPLSDSLFSCENNDFIFKPRYRKLMEDVSAL